MVCTKLFFHDHYYVILGSMLEWEDVLWAEFWSSIPFAGFKKEVTTWIENNGYEHSTYFHLLFCLMLARCVILLQRFKLNERRIEKYVFWLLHLNWTELVTIVHNTFWATDWFFLRIRWCWELIDSTWLKEYPKSYWRLRCSWKRIQSGRKKWCLCKLQSQLGQMFPNVFSPPFKTFIWVI